MLDETLNGARISVTIASEGGLWPPGATAIQRKRTRPKICPKCASAIAENCANCKFCKMTRLTWVTKPTRVTRIARVTTDQTNQGDQADWSDLGDQTNHSRRTEYILIYERGGVRTVSSFDQ